MLRCVSFSISTFLNICSAYGVVVSVSYLTSLFLSIETPIYIRAAISTPVMVLFMSFTAPKVSRFIDNCFFAKKEENTNDLELANIKDPKEIKKDKIKKEMEQIKISLKEIESYNLDENSIHKRDLILTYIDETEQQIIGDIENS